MKDKNKETKDRKTENETEGNDTKPTPENETERNREVGDGEGEEGERYKLVFEGEGCIGTGRCAEVSSNWGMDIDTGKARPRNYFFGEEDLEHNLEAARVCPAKNGEGVISVFDTRKEREVEYEESQR